MFEQQQFVRVRTEIEELIAEFARLPKDYPTAGACRQMIRRKLEFLWKESKEEGLFVRLFRQARAVGVFD